MYIFSEVLETELVDQDTSLIIQDIVRKAQAGASAHLVCVCVLRVRVRVRVSPCLSVSLSLCTSQGGPATELEHAVVLAKAALAQI